MSFSSSTQERRLTYDGPNNSQSHGLQLRWWPQLTALLLILVELFWVVPWYRTIIQVSYVASPLRATLILGCVMLVSYSLTQVFEYLKLVRALQLGALVTWLFMCLLIGSELLLNKPVLTVANGLYALDPGAVLVVFTVIWLWWRGITLGREPIRPVIAWHRFELGLLLLMAHEIIVTRLDFGSNGITLFVAYLFTGVLSVIFARVSYIGLSQGVTKNPFDRRWLVSTILILGITIGMATVLGGLLTGQYRMLLEWLASGLRFLIAIVIFIFSIPGLLLSRLLEPLMPLLRRFLNTTAGNPLEEGLERPPLPDIQAAQRPLPLSFQTIFFWGVILLVLVLLIIRARRYIGERHENFSEEPESLLKSGDAGRLLRKALQDAASELAHRLRPVHKYFVATRIRKIYAQLLELCAELNKPRASSQTPLEFLPVMGEVFPAQHADLAAITEAYIRVRYGEVPETEQEVSDLEAAWGHISEEGQRLKRAGQHKLKTVELKEVERKGV